MQSAHAHSSPGQAASTRLAWSDSEPFVRSCEVSGNVVAIGFKTAATEPLRRTP